MKLMIIGHGRHGKDTVCEILRDKYGLSFASSSMVAAEEVLYPALKDKYGYKTFEECYEDRHNHRAEWYEAIKEINTPDKTKLGRIIYGKHDIYCGIRDKEEFEALRDEGVFNFSVWVDRSDHCEPEADDSCTVTKTDAQFVLDNNGSLEDLEANIKELVYEIEAKMLGLKLKDIRKLPKGKKSFALRKMFGLLTQAEMRKEQIKENKGKITDAYATRMWTLLARAGL